MTEHQNFVENVIAGLDAMEIVIYGPRIAVVRDPEEEQTKGGIYLPEQSRRKEPRGTVVSIGLGVDDYADEGVLYGFELGDRVLYTKYNPILFTVTLPDGTDVDLELMHVSDLYIGWRQ